jgi:hypothetical protein
MLFSLNLRERPMQRKKREDREEREEREEKDIYIICRQ